jgi:tetratricopeptide (TPR) repeat protein
MRAAVHTLLHAPECARAPHAKLSKCDSPHFQVILCEVMIRPPAPPAGEQQGAAAAAALKDAGNAHFQAKRFEEALECYTRALALAPHNHLLWSNSSMARAALNQWFESEAVSYFNIRDL